MADDTQMNIYQKLAKIRAQVEVMKRDTKAYGYHYTKEESILAKITVYMKKYNLSLIPGIVRGSTVVVPYSYKKTKTTPKGDIYDEHVNDILVSADMEWAWINDESPEERVVVPWAMVGQQSDASQSFGSGLTYSSRYFLLKYFNISTSNDDPDKFRLKQREAEEAEEKVVLEQIVKSIDGHVKSFLTANPGKRDDVFKMVSKYIKSGDYSQIKESSLAAKLFQEIQTTLLIKEEE
jgi:hypothetical protein